MTETESGIAGRQGWPVGRHVLLYGLLAGAIIALLRLVEYRWLVIQYSVEIYGGIVAAIFAALGVWLGLRLTRRRERIVVREVVIAGGPEFVRNDSEVEALGLTPRELEMLEFVAGGLSNREIAERAFVSENTVKTHLSRVFDKLGAQRRTQAVQRARQLRLIA